MEKGNKVLIKNTDTIWDGKHGTVISEEDGQVEVRINFETEEGTKQVIEIFNEENLEMEREDESLNEGLSQEQIDIVIRDAKDDFEKLDNPGNVSYEYELGFTAAAFNVPFKHWKAFLPGIEEDDQKYIDFKQGYLDNNGKIDESLNEDNEEYFIVREFPSRLYVGNYKYADITQNGDVIPSPKGFDKYQLGFVEDKEDAAVFTNEQAEEVANTCGWAYRKYGMNYKIIKAPRRMINNESLNEDLEIKPTKKEDIIHRYVHLEDLDGKEVPNWNFAARIATAEDIEEGCVCELAHDLGYKVFAIEAPGFFRTVIAAKGIKAEDIEEEYADFLQGRACVRELEWK